MFAFVLRVVFTSSYVCTAGFAVQEPTIAWLKALKDTRIEVRAGVFLVATPLAFSCQGSLLLQDWGRYGDVLLHGASIDASTDVEQLIAIAKRIRFEITAFERFRIL